MRLVKAIKNVTLLYCDGNDNGIILDDAHVYCFSQQNMGGQLIVQEMKMYIGKNFLRHSVDFLGKAWFVQFLCTLFV